MPRALLLSRTTLDRADCQAPSRTVRRLSVSPAKLEGAQYIGCFREFPLYTYNTNPLQYETTEATEISKASPVKYVPLCKGCKII